MSVSWANGPIKAYRVRGNSGTDIQETIDKAFSKGGGRVIVPKGTYHVASIQLKSNIELHLNKGATLLGSKNSDEYDRIPEEICKINPEKSTKTLLYAYNVENIALTGEGVIDGQGPSFFDIDPNREGLYPKPPVQRPLMVKIVNCKDVRLEGITLKDSPCWTVLMRLCENVEIHGITITADQKMINNDGIDIDGCRHVRVSNSRFKTCDDCIVLRAMREFPEQNVVCEDIQVWDCDLNSACQTIRLGCPSDDTIRKASFINITAQGNNGIFADYPKRYLSKGDTGYMDISDIVFDNYSGEFYGSALQIVSEDAAAAYQETYCTFPMADLRDITGVEIEKNQRRKYKAQVEHLMEVRAVRDSHDEKRGHRWNTERGRKRKQELVFQWKQEYPDATMYACAKELGISRSTVKQWWNTTIDDIREYEEQQKMTIQVRILEEQRISEIRDLGAAGNSTYNMDKAAMAQILRQVPGFEKLSQEDQSGMLYDLADTVNFSDADLEEMYKAMIGIPEAARPYVHIEPSVIEELRKELSKPYDYSADLENLSEEMEKWPDEMKEVYRRQIESYRNKKLSNIVVK